MTTPRSLKEVDEALAKTEEEAKAKCKKSGSHSLGPPHGRPRKVDINGEKGGLGKETKEELQKSKNEVEQVKETFEKADRSFRDRQAAEAGRCSDGTSTRGLDTTHGNGPAVGGVASDVRAPPSTPSPEGGQETMAHGTSAHTTRIPPAPGPHQGSPAKRPSPCYRPEPVVTGMTWPHARGPVDGASPWHYRARPGPTTPPRRSWRPSSARTAWWLHVLITDETGAVLRIGGRRSQDAGFPAVEGTSPPPPGRDMLLGRRTAARTPRGDFRPVPAPGATVARVPCRT